MGCLVDRPEAFAGEMRVDLGCGEVRVTEKLLHDPEIGPTFEQVRSVGVPEDVWVQGVPIGHRKSVDDAPGVPWGQALPPLIEEDGVRWAVGPGDQWAALPEPVPEGFRGRSPQGDTADFGPLSEHRERSAVQIAVPGGQAAALGDPDPGPVQDLEDGDVLEGQGPLDRVLGSLRRRDPVEQRAGPFGARSERPESVVTTPRRFRYRRNERSDAALRAMVRFASRCVPRNARYRRSVG